ncbi:MAG TPA: hypothetical protein DCE78_07370, partial [Bacteroidetes bacterium]|nr:hypothetical protein [Bacteroidota bacterium]
MSTMRIIKICIALFYLVFIPLSVSGQKYPFWMKPSSEEADSLKRVLHSTEDDSLKMLLNRQLGRYYEEVHRITALDYYETQLSLAITLKQQLWEADALSSIGYVSSLMQNFPGALNSLLIARDIASKLLASNNLWNVELFNEGGDINLARLTVLSSIVNHLGLINYFVGNYDKALEYYEETNELNKTLNDEVLEALLYMNRGESLYGLEKYDLAKTEFEATLKAFQNTGYVLYTGLVYWDIGKIYEAEENYREAKKYYELSVKTSIEVESPDFLGEGYLALSNIYDVFGQPDSSYFSAQQAFTTFQAMSDTLGLIKAHTALASVFDKRSQIDNAYYHMKEAQTLTLAINRDEKVKEFQVLGLNEQIRLNELETERVLVQSRFQIYGLGAGIGVLLLISTILYRNSNRQKKDKATIELAYKNLKSAQNQLVQQEKLASLGQLTAGIAHEIKNPLNFVNNFSEVSLEMVDEAMEEVKRGWREGVKERRREGEKKKKSEGEKETEVDRALILEILDDIKTNLTKIHEHGSRADGIVKSMLMHSRGGTGSLEPTDLNGLVREYVNLSYHGMRAGKHPIDVDIELKLDESVGEVPLIAQDFSRVILNLCNNAFDAMGDKKERGEEVNGRKNTSI